VSEESLSIADYNAERELRTQYLTAVGQFLSQAATLLEGKPEALPFLLKMVQWVTASFRGSSDIESVLDEAIQLTSQPKPPPPPDPAIAIEQAKQQFEKEKGQFEAINNEKITQMELASAERIAQMGNDNKVLIEQMKDELAKVLAGTKTEQTLGSDETKVMIERMRLASEAIQAALDRASEESQTDSKLESAEEVAKKKEAE